VNDCATGDALYKALTEHHSDVAVGKFIISAMGNLCIIENNKQRLGSLGACELIVQTMSEHINDLETAKAAGLAIGKLCENISRSMESEYHANSEKNEKIGAFTTTVNRSRESEIIAANSHTPEISTPTSSYGQEQAANMSSSDPRRNRELLYTAGCCEVSLDLVFNEIVFF
jgi:hypothetical protein